MDPNICWKLLSLFTFNVMFMGGQAELVANRFSGISIQRFHAVVFIMPYIVNSIITYACLI